MSVRLFAVVAEGSRGRVYVSPIQEHVDAAETAKPSWRPQQALPDNPRDFKTPNYGMTTFGDLFTDRQLVALTTFSDLVGEARAKVLADAQAAGRTRDLTPLAEGGTGAQAYADAVAVYLAFSVDKATTRNCSLTIWEPGMGRLAGAMGRQALPMQWSFAETNPLAGAGGDIAGTAVSISEVLDRAFPCPAGSVNQFNAANGVIEVALPAVATDPPYYDNIGYADLSDFFYVWLRGSLREVFPREFATLAVPKNEELVATPYRFDGGRDEAEAFFMDGMRRAIANIRIASVDAVPTTIYYAFKQSEVEREGVVSTGWATFLEAICGAGLQVDGTWPVRTEATNALKRGVNALASSIVLVCRKRPADATAISRAEFLRALRREMPKALATLQEAAIAPVDMAQASIGPGMALFSRYAAVLEADDSRMTVKMALALINQFLDEFLAEQEGEFDRASRFAVTWFEQYGFNDGPYGEAEVLARARDVSVAGVQSAGLVRQGGGKVRLLRRDELDATWDIRTDDRITVWECCQHLIRRLEEEGVDGAARLLKSMGHYGEQGRDLAYRLFALCERRKWADEARSYNGLVVAWPEIVKRTDEVPADPLPGRDGRQAEMAV